MGDDANCRPIAFMLMGGDVVDCVTDAELLARLPTCEILHGDKGRQRRDPAARRERRRDAEHPAQGQPKMEELLFAVRSSIAIATPSNACSAA